MSPKAKCPDCNGTHDLPFSDRVYQLYKMFQASADQGDRFDIALELAAVFADEHDETNSSFTESYHDIFEDYFKVRQSYNMSSLKVARLAETVISGYLESHSVIEAPTSDKNVN